MEVEVVEANLEVLPDLGNSKQHWRDVMTLFSLTSFEDVWSGIQQQGWLQMPLFDTLGFEGDYHDLLRYTIDINLNHTLVCEMKVHQNG